MSIVPRATSLGYRQMFPSDIKLYSKERLHDMMCMLLAGRAAEQVMFDRVSTNAEDDMKQVTKMAYRQVCEFGMSDTVCLAANANTQTQHRCTHAYMQCVLVP